MLRFSGIASVQRQYLLYQLINTLMVGLSKFTTLNGPLYSHKSMLQRTSLSRTNDVRHRHLDLLIAFLVQVTCARINFFLIAEDQTPFLLVHFNCE